jgi:hypothetical protein
MAMEVRQNSYLAMKKEWSAQDSANNRSKWRTAAKLFLSFAYLFVAYASLASFTDSIDAVANREKLAASEVVVSENSSQIPKAARLGIGQVEQNFLSENAIDATALRLGAQARFRAGNAPAGLDLLSLARRVKRRDVASHVLLIEWYANHNDLQQVVMLYDEALRTSGEARTALFPILARALEDVEVRNALTPLFKSKTNWMIEFLYFSGFRSDTTAATARLIEQVGPLPDDQYSREFQSRFLAQLIASNLYAEAHRFYRRMPGADPKLLSDVRFWASSGKDQFRPIAWLLPEGKLAEANFLPSNAKLGGLKLHVLATSAVPEIVAYRIAYLMPGTYQLRVNAQVGGMTASSKLDWIVQCLNANKVLEIAHLSLTLDNPRQSQLATPFSVSASCEAIRLSAYAAGGVSDSPSQVTVDEVMFVQSGTNRRSVEND